MTSLARQSCLSSPHIRTLSEYQSLLHQLDHWHIIDDHHLEKSFKFSNFVSALSFTNQVGAIAESENHHPDIHLSWGKATITIWTHSINGLTDNDFILAAKIDQCSHK